MAKRRETLYNHISKTAARSPGQTDRLADEIIRALDLVVEGKDTTSTQVEHYVPRGYIIGPGGTVEPICQDTFNARAQFVHENTAHLDIEE